MGESGDRGSDLHSLKLTQGFKTGAMMLFDHRFSETIFLKTTHIFNVLTR